MKQQFWALVILALLALVPAAQGAVTSVDAEVFVNNAPALQVNGMDVVQLGQAVTLDVTATTDVPNGGIVSIMDTSELPVFSGPDSSVECDYSANPVPVQATCSQTYLYDSVPADDVDTLSSLAQDTAAGTLVGTHDIFVNAPPALVIASFGSATLNEAYNEDFVSATDQNIATNLRFTAAGLPAGLIMDLFTGRITGTPTVTGTFQVTITANDGYFGQDSGQITFYVNSLPQSNRNPAFDSVASTAAMVGQQYSYTAHATDLDGDTLSYTLVSGPLGMTVDKASGFTRWVPQSTQLGTHDVTIKVGDGKGGSDLQSYTIVVSSQSLVIKSLEASADKVAPAGKLDVSLDIRNLWGKDAQNAKAEVTIRNIDGGNDLTETVEFGELANKDTESGTATFMVPFNAKEGTYQVSAKLTWEDEDGVEFSTDGQRTDKFKVERATHGLVFQEVAFLPSTVSAGGSAQVGFRLANVGDKDEMVSVAVKSDSLGLSMASAAFKLERGKETIQFIPFQVSGDARAGNYLFEVTATFADGQATIVNTSVLEIRAAPAAPVTEVEPAVTAVVVAPTGAVTVQQTSSTTLDTNVVVAVGIIAAAIVVTIAILATTLVPRGPTPPRSIVLKGRRAQ